jgi:hypothetical protein
MARMPQIPEPEISDLPHIGVGHENVDVDSEIAPFNMAAKGATQGLNDLSELQSQKEDALAKLQKSADETTATKLAGDHAEKLRNLAPQLQTTFWNNPDKYPDEFRKQSLAITDAEISAAPNENVALELAKRNAVVDNQQLAVAHAWSVSRTAQKAKSDLTGIERNSIDAVSSSPTIEQFSYQLKQAHSQLDPLYDKITSDTAKASASFDSRVAQEWIARNSDPQKNPLSVMEELQKNNSPIHQLLTQEQINKGMKQAKEAFEGAGVMQRVGMLTRAHDGVGDLNALAAAKDPKFLRTTAALRDEVNSHLNLLAQQQIPQAAKDQIKASSQRVMEAIDNAESIYRSQKGSFDSSMIDEKARRSLIERSNALFAKTVPAGDHLQEMLDLRADNNKAAADKKIPESTWKAIEDKLSAGFSRINDARSKDTGDFLWRNPQQAGNQRVDDLLDEKTGRYANATQKQRNDIWEQYLEHVNAAAKSGGKFDNNGARKAADQAAEFVMSQPNE